MRTPMPSPRGTNHARLFVNRSPAGAYDAMPADAAADLLEFLRDKLSPEDHSAFAKMLGVADPDAAMDEPADFIGKPLVGGGKFGEDSRRRRSYSAADEADFAKRHPGAARIKVNR